MVESTALEMRHTGNRIGGSNPSLSANRAHTRPERDVLSGDYPRAGPGTGEGNEQRHRGPSAAISCDHKTEMILHRRKIAVIVQQRVTMLDAECADDDVGCLADRDP